MADAETPRLAGRVVLITGAESGIGRETALRAAAEGARIGAIGLDERGLDAVVEQVGGAGGRAVAKCADVSDAGAIAGAVDEIVHELGALDVVHANAGILVAATTTSTSTSRSGTGSWPSTSPE